MNKLQIAQLCIIVSALCILMGNLNKCVINRLMLHVCGTVFAIAAFIICMWSI